MNFLPLQYEQFWKETKTKAFLEMSRFINLSNDQSAGAIGI